MPIVAPFGSWQSPVTTDLMTGRTIGLSFLTADGEALYWIESRPSEAGRSTLMRWTEASGAAEMTPLPRDVGSRVHEYGGGAYAVSGGSVIFSDRREGSVWLIADGGEARPVARVEGCRYADFAFDRARDRVIAVREDHRGRPPNDPRNTLVALDLSDAGNAEGNEGIILVEGADFVAAPRISPDGTALLWIEWQHPEMPWDGTRLWMAEFDARGHPSSPVLIAGAEPEAVLQPEWDLRGGGILFLSDRTGWWNPYHWHAGRVTAVAPVEGEIGGPAWQLAVQHYALAPDGAILAAMTRAGSREAVRLQDGRWIRLPLDPVAQAPIPFGAGFAAIVTPAARPPGIVIARSLTGDTKLIQSSGPVVLSAEDVSLGQPITFPSGDGGFAHAVFYPPVNSRFVGPEGVSPPLVVLIHGGPTSMSHASFSLSVQWWTSRGIAVADVNYRGSSGYGRDYRQLLDGEWGVRDVEDCIAVVGYLTDAGMVDPERVAIRGGSAGGFTVLAALTRSSVFKAGASLYGVADLMLLAADTHKFESRYLDRLIGKLPEAAPIYRERSPLSHVDAISAPAIFFQGADDRVVPPNQAEQMVEAMIRKQLPVAHYVFPGEGHGFRQAATIRGVLELELGFYARIFGFEAYGLQEKVEIRNLPGEAA